MHEEMLGTATALFRTKLDHSCQELECATKADIRRQVQYLVLPMCDAVEGEQ